MLNKLRPVILQLLPPVVVNLVKQIVLASPYRAERVVRATPEHPQGAAILQEAWRHLDACAESDRNAARLPESARWTTLLQRMRASIPLFKNAEEAILFAQTRLDFDHRLPVKEVAHLFRLHADTLRAEFPHFAAVVDQVSDSPFSRPNTMLRAGKQLVSNVLFFHLRYILQCLTWVPQPESVCEIGGGYGSPARLWLLNPIHRPTTYLIIDFPESLFFADAFLRSNFDRLSLHYVTSQEPLDPEFVKRHQVVLCPIRFAAALGKTRLDLVINTGSMQEMTEEWIDFWMDWLRRQDCRYFYSLNYFAQPLSFMAEGGNTWSPRLTPEWTVRLQRANPPLVMQQTVRNFAEILAEKTDVSPLWSGQTLASRYEQTKERALDHQVLLECMDIVRHRPGEDILWHLLQRLMNLRTLPKETYFLADALSTQASAAFRQEHGAGLAEIMATVRRVRAAGHENRVDPVV